MAIRIEISGVEHPYQLCFICNDALGWNRIVIEPGHPRQREIFVCMEHLGDALKEFGDSVARMIEMEREQKEKRDETN